MGYIPTGTPMVSVLVRSMDRPQLHQALDSLMLQTYPNIEILVINALGSNHSPLGTWCGSFPLRLVGTGAPLRRSEAANVGLEHAAGDYLLFLDDDDWLAPHHISSLVAVLSGNCDCQVAYAGVELRDVDGGVMDAEPFNANYNAGRLRCGNYIPIHAILFSRVLVNQGLRFDEAFDVYEDWDFLLELSQFTHFEHVDTISAYYRASGTSGVGMKVDKELRRRSRERIFEKWKNRWTGAQIDEMVCAAGDIEREKLAQMHHSLNQTNSILAEREHQLEDMANEVRALKDRLLERDRTLKIVNGRLYNVLHSCSWRLTAPLRWPGRGARRALSRIVDHSLGLDRKSTVAQGLSDESISKPVNSGEMPLISVIIPVYNACRINQRFLLCALESIANQTYPNVELIIVNDGSTDETHQVCEDFLKRHQNLRAQYLRKENGGQSSARNFGVQACHGEYVSFLDQDDEWYEDKLERIVPWLRHKDIDVLYTDADSIDGDDKVTFSNIHQIHLCGWPHPKRKLEDILFNDIFVMPGLMTIKRQAFERIGGFDEKLSGYEDDDLFLRLFQTCRIFYLPIPTLRWRMYGNNYSFSQRMLTSRMFYWKKLLKDFTDNGANRFRVHMISWRFFRMFMSQSLLQYRTGNALCWKSLAGAREILPHLPWFQRLLFSFIFLFPDRLVLPKLEWSRILIRMVLAG